MDRSFLNRVNKQFRHLGKWARRCHITAFRVYDHDLPEFPAIVDWIEGDCVVWIYPRTRDDTAQKQAAFRDLVTESLLAAFDMDPARLWIKERKIQKGVSQQYSRLGRRGVQKVVSEGDLKFELNLSDYLDVGLFLDHRKTRQMVRELSDGLRVLNLFAYTGSFSCYAASGGALETVSVDLNPNYGEWIQRNLTLNGFEVGNKNRIVSSDCLHFLQNTRPGKFDLVICDPPTFSNSRRKNAHSFGIVEDYPSLINAILRVLDSKGILIFSTNAKRFEMDINQISKAASIQEISTQTESEDFRNRSAHRCWLIQSI